MGAWRRWGAEDALPGEGKVKLARRRRRHSHGVGVDRVEDHLRGTGRRLGHHIWGEENGVRAGWEAPKGTKPHQKLPFVPRSNLVTPLAISWV